MESFITVALHKFAAAPSADVAYSANSAVVAPPGNLNETKAHDETISTPAVSTPKTNGKLSLGITQTAQIETGTLEAS